MLRMFFVVKGNRDIAAKECQRRKIEYLIDGESENHNETYCYALITERPKIVEWYCEVAGLAQIASTGDCLWYAERYDE